MQEITYKLNGEVVTLEMHISEFQRLIFILGIAAANDEFSDDINEFVIRLNRTNPNFCLCEDDPDRDLKLFQIAQRVTDETFGPGTYVRQNGFDPSKGETYRRG